MSMYSAFEWKDLPDLVEHAGLTNGFTVGMFADHLYTGPWLSVQDDLMREHADVQLESIRVFDEAHELKIFRKNGRFCCRDSNCYAVVRSPDDVTDIGGNSDRIPVNSIEERQLLDIDTRKSTGIEQVYATGGGTYSLKGSGLKSLEGSCVVLEEYIRYYESGQAYVFDWRIVRFENGKGE